MNFSFENILMDGITDMVFVMRVVYDNNIEFVYDFVNRSAIDGTGITKNALGKSIRDVRPLNHANKLYEHYNTVISSKKGLTFEDSFLSIDGDVRFSESKLTPLFDEEGICRQIVSVTTNITKEKLAELKSKETWIRLMDSKKAYQSLFNHNSDAIISFDLNGRITDSNIVIKDITGYTPDELIGSTLDKLVIKEDVDQISKLFKLALNGSTKDSRLSILDKTGNQVEIFLKVAPLIIDDAVAGIYGILRDVSVLVNSQKQLKESEEHFRIIAENAHDLISLINEKGEIIYASPSYQDILGINHKEYKGNLFLHNIDPDDLEHVNQKVNQSKLDGRPFTVQFKQFNSKNQAIWSHAHGTPVFDSQNNFKHLVVITRDISLQKKYEEKLHHFANHDSLTGLPNRRLFKERLTAVMMDHSNGNNHPTVIMMDIDNFKDINDELGHDIGDCVIEELGKRISKAIGPNNLVARLGGDEFVVLLTDTDSTDQAISLAKAIQHSLQQPWDIQNYSLVITISVGIATAPTQSATAHSMLKNADVAMYQAKNDGGNTYKVIHGTLPPLD